MRRVILSADDFGLDKAVNEAVEIAHRDGVLTSTSLMVGEAAVADAVERARRMPRLRVGLHLVLADGWPVSPPASIPLLVDERGRFPKDMVGVGFKFFFSPAARRQIAREIRAQFEAFAATGLTLDHVDGHKHIQLHPTVAQLILRIGREFGLRALRVPMEPAGPIVAARVGGGNVGIGASALRLWSGGLMRAVRREGLQAADQIFGLAWTGDMNEAKLLALLPNLPPGTSEIYFHPATTRTATLIEAMPDYRHEAELAALLSPAVSRALGDLGIASIGYADMAGAVAA